MKYRLCRFCFSHLWETFSYERWKHVQNKCQAYKEWRRMENKTRRFIKSIWMKLALMMKGSYKAKASFTIEAAVIVPLVLFVIVAGINIGYDLFAQTKAAAEIHADLTEFNPVKIVRNHAVFQELVN